MLKLFSVALVAMPITFGSAQALDNYGANRAADAFAAGGVQGLATAGRGGGDFFAYQPTEEPTFAGPAYDSGYVVGYVRTRQPRCWTRYVTAASGNTLINMPVTTCR